jgi:hypothetical protein
MLVATDFALLLLDPFWGARDRQGNYAKSFMKAKGLVGHYFFGAFFINRYHNRLINRLN